MKIKPKDFTVISIKVKPADLERMKTKARKHAGGNLSGWIRYAALNCKYTGGAIEKDDFSRNAQRVLDDEEDFF